MARILIVDDEEKIREMIRKYAEYEGFEVFEAKDGLEAVTLCQENKYDLVIMDVMMPNLDGFSAVKEIKKTSPNLPFIMLSALGEEYDRVHGFDIGVDDYVVKPFFSKELMMRIHAILKRTQNETDHEVFQLENMTIDYSARTVTIETDMGEVTIKDIEQKLGFTGTNAYYHLMLMMKTGMLETRNQGRTVFYRIHKEYFIKLCKAIKKYAV